MRNIHICAAILAVGLWLSGCSPAAETASQPEAAQQALIEYFALLHDGRYQEAAGLYGGTYDVLASWNPEQEPADHAALLESGCTRNGLRCLEVLEATSLPGSSPTHFVFDVQFRNDDGSLFVLGPCCGATATEMPPQDTFAITVETTTDGRLVVMELPVYVP